MTATPRTGDHHGRPFCVPYQVEVAGPDRLASVLAVQRQGFARVAAQLDIPPDALPPLRETLAELEALHARGTRFFSAVSAAGEVIGTVRATVNGDEVEIGRLAVADGWERKGVATALMDAVESSFPEAERFTIFTGANATAPLALYQGRGYRESRREDAGHVTIVWLEKRP